MAYYSPPHLAGVRNCNGATFASFKKFASHFLNTPAAHRTKRGA
ncbi:hypothetical protein [Ferruginibacter lapsinanis]|nr:hypothetical protein [Ferruginibacter lapsinanis]